MKTALQAIIVATPLLLSQLSFAGVNGTYRVSGSETESGGKTTFTGTVKITDYRKGTYALKMKDGENPTYIFTFDKPLKETTASQTFTAKNKIGTASGSIFRKDGKMRVKFTYKSLDGSVRGQGSGSK